MYWSRQPPPSLRQEPHISHQQHPRTKVHSQHTARAARLQPGLQHHVARALMAASESHAARAASVPSVGAGCILITGWCLATGTSVGSAWIMMAFAGTQPLVWVLGAAGSNKGLGWIEGLEFIWSFFFRVSPFSGEKPNHKSIWRQWSQSQKTGSIIHFSQYSGF